LGPVWGVDVS